MKTASCVRAVPDTDIILLGKQILKKQDEGVWGSVVPEHELQLVFPSLYSLIFQYSLNCPHNWEETLACII